MDTLDTGHYANYRIKVNGMITKTEKTCKMCKQLLPLTSFGRSGKKHYMGKCKQCCKRTHKHCPRCKQNLELHHFYNGKVSYCKVCMADLARINREKQREEARLNEVPYEEKFAYDPKIIQVCAPQEITRKQRIHELKFPNRSTFREDR